MDDLERFEKSINVAEPILDDLGVVSVRLPSSSRRVCVGAGPHVIIARLAGLQGLDTSG